MFFKQIRRNARRSRKENGLFFSSLVIAIIAFYTLLSLESQDVMVFLKTMESDAVSKLMLLIPLVYMVSLFFVLFLVYFAYRYQLEGRRREFGMYLMLGMRRSRLFGLLMGETLWNSIVSIILGIPCALLLTESISLATAKLVGLGIVGHRISFSLSALLGTVGGFIAVQIIAMLSLSAQLCRKEPMELLKPSSSEKQTLLPRKRGWVCFIAGLALLIIAYGLGVILLRSLNFMVTLAILVFGIGGTFLLYKGMGTFIGGKIRRKSPDCKGLFTFTGRQIQENVINQHKSLAVASLLMLMAISCVSFGIGMAASRISGNRSVDFSIEGTKAQVEAALGDKMDLVSSIYPMYVDSIDADICDLEGNILDKRTHEFSWEGMVSVLEGLKQTDTRDNLLENFKGRSNPYLIKESSYNSMLESMGKEPIKLEKNQSAVYSSLIEDSEAADILDTALKRGAYFVVDGQNYNLADKEYTDNIVADRSITIYCGLIVPDELYTAWVLDKDEIMCWNIYLSEKIVREKGLMQAIELVEGNISKSGLEYESYLNGIGRNLFYTVASSYITVYLGVLFMIIANTVIALKYLMQQRASTNRYTTLLMLGATINDLCKSSKSQIRLFFTLTIGVSAISGVFAVWSMFTSFMRLPSGHSVAGVVAVSSIAFIIFIVIEFIYMYAVERTSSREIQQLEAGYRR